MWLFVLVVLAGCQKTEVAMYDNFAQCLTDKNVKMYGTERCPHCKDQKKLFGKSFKKVNYIDCDKDSMKCDLAGVEWFPTRIGLDGVKRSGTQSLEDLAKNYGCSLDESSYGASGAVMTGSVVSWGK